MRLNGYFKAGPLEAAYVTVLLAIPRLRIEQRIELLIDTGATRTTILDKDAITLGIPYSKLPRLKQPLLGLGGLVDTSVARDAEMYFKSESGQEHKELVEELLVVKHRRVDENIMRIPSVLGRDILNKYRLIYDKRS
ncbi:MAG: aspartyl protease family protein, partial [Candidatus Bathyarchaeia archaeon]